MKPKTQDRGLIAVARVREISERASRVALERAMAAVREQEAQLRRREADLARARLFEIGTVADFQLAHRAASFLVQSVRGAERALSETQSVAMEAHTAWSRDKAQLRAVELLLERREQRRRDERERLERNELDEMAGRAWARSRAGGEA